VYSAPSRGAALLVAREKTIVAESFGAVLVVRWCIGCWWIMFLVEERRVMGDDDVRAQLNFWRLVISGYLVYQFILRWGGAQALPALSHGYMGEGAGVWS